MIYIFMIVLLVSVFREARLPFRKGESWFRGLLRMVAGGFLLVGFLGFFAPRVAPDWPQLSFEWPVGQATNVLAYRDGTLVVGHKPSGRIQVYDENHDFVRGWFLEEGVSGTFKLAACSESSFYVYTARGSHRYEFDFLGTTLSSSTYAEPYESFPPAGGAVVLPFPFYLTPLLSPFVAFVFAMIGAALGYPLHSVRRPPAQEVPPYTPIVPPRSDERKTQSLE